MLWRATLIAVAIGAAFAPIDPALVERAYSTGVFATLQPIVTTVSNRAAFALFDVFIGGVVTLLVILTVRDLRRARRAGALRVIVRLAVCAAAMYLAFLLTWGLNYRRERLTGKLAFDERAVTAPAASALAGTTVEQLNALYLPAHAMLDGSIDHIDSELVKAFNAAVRAIGASPVVVARPKRSIADWYFRRAAVSGMTDPFFLETLIASDVLPFERPFVVAHEWSHLAGIAHEGEANFVGWVACLHGSAAHRYSGWLLLYQELVPSLGREERRAVAARLDDGPRADLRAIQERYVRNVNPAVSAAGWRIYDSYLKANRIESGAASYAEVTRLVLGTRFGEDWTPVLRDAR
jgi:hypothetical protein